MFSGLAIMKIKNKQHEGKNRQGLLIDPARVDLFESPKPFKRFMRLLIDPKMFPKTPVTIAMVQYPPGAQGPLHLHRKTTEIYFVLSGELTPTIEGKQYRVKRGQLLYIPCGKEHRAANHGRMSCCFMTINTPLARDLPELKVRNTWKKVKQ